MASATYEDFADSLNMLENDCEPLKFEVFVTYSKMIAGGAHLEFKPQDIMLHAMMEWDLA